MLQPTQSAITVFKPASVLEKHTAYLRLLMPLYSTCEIETPGIIEQWGGLFTVHHMHNMQCQRDPELQYFGVIVDIRIVSGCEQDVLTSGSILTRSDSVLRAWNEAILPVIVSSWKGLNNCSIPGMKEILCEMEIHSLWMCVFFHVSRHRGGGAGGGGGGRVMRERGRHWAQTLASALVR